jgi:large exoprotein involved in heme utilization and adhesion
MKAIGSACTAMFSFGLFISAAPAQVIPDGTLNTTINAVGNNFTIDNGTVSGSNLFHSFREFSIPTGGSAIFNNATNIQNIFSCVTWNLVQPIPTIAPCIASTP